MQLLGATNNIMFMVLGGRGYHGVRVRTILHSWARCVKHVRRSARPIGQHFWLRRPSVDTSISRRVTRGGDGHIFR